MEPRALVRALVADVAIVAGALGLSVGAWMAAPPAGLMVGGVLLLAGGLRAARPRGRS